VGAKRVLADLARQDDLSFQDELAALVERERRRRILDATNAGYEELRKSPEEWAEFQREIKMWENTLADGLDEI